MKKITKEQMKTFLRLSGWSFTGTWWTKRIEDEDGFSMKYEHLNAAYLQESTDRSK